MTPQAVLCERDAAAFQFDAAGVAWRGARLGNQQLAQARQAAHSFGSCSFREPAGELQALGLI